MKELLVQGEHIQVSNEDYEFVLSLKLCFDRGYPHTQYCGKPQFLHTLIAHRMGMTLSCNRVVDHMERNPKNLQRWNLRPATYRQSNLNKSIQKCNCSGFHGVHWDKQLQFWIAQVRISGRKKYLGRFKTPEEAARARDYYCYRSFDREFYTYNFPKELDFSDLRIRLRFHLGKGKGR